MTVQDKKEWVMTASAVVMLAWAATLTTVGFAISPSGEIHDSVLWVLGQAFLYAGGIFGIREAGKMSARREVERKWREYERRRGRSRGMDNQEGEYNDDGGAVAHETREEEEQ